MKAEVKREIITGIIAGALFLGMGGRVVMRVVAIAEGRVPTWTPEGVVAVTLFGAAFGLLGAVIHLLLFRLVPKRPALRETLFLIALVLITLRGLNGQMVPAAGLFVVAMLLYWVSMTTVSFKGFDMRRVVPPAAGG